MRSLFCVFYLYLLFALNALIVASALTQLDGDGMRAFILRAIVLLMNLIMFFLLITISVAFRKTELLSRSLGILEDVLELEISQVGVFSAAA